MMKLIKENFVLVMGITLPVLLVLAFFISNNIAKALITPPEYGFIFSTSQYQYNKKENKISVDFKVKENQISATFKKGKDKNNNKVQLFYFNEETENIEELDFEFPDKIKEGDSKTILISSTKSFKINKKQKSPDGYIYEHTYRGSQGIIGGLFGFGRGSRYVHMLVKAGSNYNLPIHKNNPYYYNNSVEFIGWVIKK